VRIRNEQKEWSSMAIKDQIRNGIGAHGVWKQHLESAIEGEHLLFSYDVIERDDCCELGKWLYSDTIPPQVRSSQHYQTVRDLHADFHRVASIVARLSESDKQRAKTVIEGEFKDASLKLTTHMMKWINEIHE